MMNIGGQTENTYDRFYVPVCVKCIHVNFNYFDQIYWDTRLTLYLNLMIIIF